MSSCHRLHGEVLDDSHCHKHHEARRCEGCSDPLVLMYIDDNGCTLDDTDDEKDCRWWDTEGAQEEEERHCRRFHSCRACFCPRVLMFIDDNLSADEQFQEQVGGEWCLIEDEEGRRRWHRRRRCCDHRILMHIDEDPCQSFGTEDDEDDK